MTSRENMILTCKSYFCSLGSQYTHGAFCEGIVCDYLYIYKLTDKMTLDRLALKFQTKRQKSFLFWMVTLVLSRGAAILTGSNNCK